MEEEKLILVFNSLNEYKLKSRKSRTSRNATLNFCRRKLFCFIGFMCVGMTFYFLIGISGFGFHTKYITVEPEQIPFEIILKNESMNFENITTIFPVQISTFTKSSDQNQTLSHVSTSKLPMVTKSTVSPTTITTSRAVSPKLPANISTVRQRQPSSEVKTSVRQFTTTTTTTKPTTAISTTITETVETIGCQLPKLKPFDPSIIEFVGVPTEVKCTSSRSKIFFKTDLNSNLITMKNLTAFGLSNCCYKDLIRVNSSEENTTFSDACVPISRNVTSIPEKHEHIGVFCDKIVKTVKKSKKSKVKTNILKLKPSQLIDMFGLTPIKPNVEKRIKMTKKRLKSKKSSNPLNIVILGLDGMSHMNFLRTMPKTYTYITETLGGIGMNGYVKVGDNTFPNLVPVLTGVNVSELESTCWEYPDKEFDDCPFLWKNYSAQGFRTSYGEDAAWMSTFNYDKRGFKKVPTDYYLRPLLYAQDELIGHVRPSNANLCFGPRLAMSVLLDNIEKMANRPELRPYFQFIWANSLTHDELNLPMLGDSLVFSTLTRLNKGGHLNHTIFILMSDHGMRWGDIRATSQGKIEERMPFLYFAFPKWFSGKYRSAIKNLKLNRERLTTPFDLHETLVDLIQPENFIPDAKIKKRVAHAELLGQNELPRGVSLFMPIPLYRTCPMAEISEHWCVCHRMIQIPIDSEIVPYAAEYVIESLNTMLKEYSQCAQLGLFRIWNAEVLQTENEELNNSTETLTVTFQTMPGYGIFESTLNRNIESDWMVGDISRTNAYGRQSSCVSDFNIKKYCFCLSEENADYY